MGVEHNKKRFYHYFSRELPFCVILHVKMTKLQISSNQIKFILKLFRNVYLVGVGHTMNVV